MGKSPHLATVYLTQAAIAQNMAGMRFRTRLALYWYRADLEGMAFALFAGTIVTGLAFGIHAATVYQGILEPRGRELGPDDDARVSPATR